MGYSGPIHVLLMHQDPVALVGLTAALGRFQDFELVECAWPDGSFRLGPDDPKVDVAVTDYDGGLALAALAARRTGPGACKVIILAASLREWEIRRALEKGVRGYLLVGCSLDELAAAVRAVHFGGRHLSPEVAPRLAEILSADPLTPREEEVLRLVADGLGNKAIARRLDIAVGTVKSHMKGIFDKLSVESRTQAICAAQRRGLLREEELHRSAADRAARNWQMSPHADDGPRKPLDQTPMQQPYQG